MCKFNIDDLINTADEMAMAAATIGNSQQSYEQFVRSRENLKKVIENLRNCKHQ